MARRIFWVVFIVSGCILVVSSCAYSAQKISNTGDIPASIQSQLASGGLIYAQTCATSICHGTQGQGIKSGNSFSAWPLVGKIFQSRHPNAQVVFDVIRSGGERNLLALTDQQVYDAIAYELKQNQIALTSPLTAENAFTTYGGAMLGKVPGGLFPPSDNAALIDSLHTRELPIAAQNDKIRIQIDQIAEASVIGETKPPEGGVFLIVVIVLTNTNRSPVIVTPKHLRLSTANGDLLSPQPINIHSAIEKLHEQTIKPQHGTAGVVVFALTAADGFDLLIYDDGSGEPIRMALKS